MTPHLSAKEHAILILCLVMFGIVLTVTTIPGGFIIDEIN
jgi:hypothetical protein